MEEEFETTYHDVERGHWWSVGRRDAILRLMEAGWGTDPVLDVGCSGGRLVEALAQRGFTARGIDVSHRAVAHAQRRGIDVVLGAADQLNVADGSIGTVIASDVLEHIDDDVRALREWRRVLIPGGALIVFVPAHPFLWSLHDERNHHRRRYERRTLTHAIRRAGFELTRLSGWNSTLFAPIATARTAQRLRRKHDSPPDFQMPPTWLNSSLRVLLELENRWLVRHNLPIGVSLMALALNPGTPCERV
ncbi:MAG: class I SAM-dependent methyltransferase [Myxococcota bacterium]